MKKRLPGILLLLCMVLTLLPTAVFAMNGDGTAENPYLLSNKDDLKQFRERKHWHLRRADGRY